MKPEKFDIFQGHSWCEFPKTQDVKENKLIKIILDTRTCKIEGYKHVYISPIVFISSVEGKSFYFGFLLPQKPSKTTRRVRYFSSIMDSNLTASKSSIVNFINT